MTDQVRNAFNNWFLSPTRLPPENPYSGDTATAFNAGFEAARDHYAPKLSPLKDVELVAAAQAYGCGTADHLQTLAVVKALEAIGAFNAPKLTFEEAIEKAGDTVEKLVSRGRFPGDSEFDYALEMSAAAFRAAGMRFKEEA